MSADDDQYPRVPTRCSEKEHRKRGKMAKPSPGAGWLTMLVRPAARKTPPTPGSPKTRKRGRPRKNAMAQETQRYLPVAKMMRASSSSSSSGLLDLAGAASEELKEKKSEKFTDYEIDHLVFVRMSKQNNWIPAQITAISHSLGGRRTTYDVEFFLKDKNGYTRAENLSISRLEPVTRDSFDRHSWSKHKSKRWGNAIEELKESYNKSCVEGQRLP